jgi:hypothetical protein
VSNATLPTTRIDIEPPEGANYTPRVLTLLIVAALAKPPARPPRATAPAPERPTHESTYDRLKPSLFTIEVHSGNANAKSTLGSGYLVSVDGLLITNYHVVGSYIEDPERFQLRANNGTGPFVARLVSFDLVNDLALLAVSGVRATPLPLARRPPQPGSAVVAFGNPEGLGLSLVDGIFNGYAEKGLVDRMLLSMPLNAGMSGGPILNGEGQVIGTNVAVERDSNSLSFGVPATKIAALLASPPLAEDRKSLLAETRRQLAALERDTAARLLRDFQAMGDATIAVGNARAARPPSVFECWDNSEQHKEEGVTKSQYSCNLQFTPYVETLGEVASLHLLVEHFAVTSAAYGFFGWLEQHAQSHNQVEPIPPTSDAFSPPRCMSERVRIGDVAWKVTSCASAYVEHDGMFDFDLVATSLSSPKDVMFVSFQASGFRLQPFLRLSRRYLESVRPAGERP